MAKKKSYKIEDFLKADSLVRSQNQATTFAQTLISKPIIQGVNDEFNTAANEARQEIKSTVGIEASEDYSNASKTTSKKVDNKTKTKKDTNGNVRTVIHDISDKNAKIKSKGYDVRLKEVAAKEESNKWHKEGIELTKQQMKLQQTRFKAGIVASVPNTMAGWLGKIRQGH